MTKPTKSETKGMKKLFEFEITYYKKQIVEAESKEQAREMLQDLVTNEYVISDGKEVESVKQKV